MLASTMVPVASFESVLSVVGILELVFCIAMIIATIVKKAPFGFMTCLVLLCLGVAWVGISRGGSSPDSFDTSDGYEILWKWRDGTYHDEPQSYSEILYEEAKKERYYSMHVSGGVSPQFYHPDSLWVAPLIAVALGLIITPQLWTVWYLLLAWALKPED